MAQKKVTVKAKGRRVQGPDPDDELLEEELEHEEQREDPEEDDELEEEELEDHDQADDDDDDPDPEEDDEPDPWERNFEWQDQVDQRLDRIEQALKPRRQKVPKQKQKPPPKTPQERRRERRRRRVNL